MNVIIIPIVIGALGTITKRIDTKTGRLGNKRMSGNHPNYRTVETSENTEKSPRELRILAVTQSTIKIPLKLVTHALTIFPKLFITTVEN